jgi:hypothetical protein
MPRLDDLPPDLRATLSLLVDRGKSYAQVAELLGIPESAVRDRAHAALDALAGAPAGLDAPSVEPPIHSTRRPAAPERATSPPGPAGASTTLPVSRRGGAALLAGIVVVVVVVVVLLTSGGGGSSHTNTGTNTTASTPANTTSTAATGTKSSSSKKTPAVTKQLTLTSPEPGSKSIGIVEILAEGTQHAFYLAAEHLPPTKGFFYAVWLYNSPTSSEAISKSPAVGSDGRLQGGALLPSNAADYHQILLTRETSERPTHPGPTVLSGPFSLG